MEAEIKRLEAELENLRQENAMLVLALKSLREIGFTLVALSCLNYKEPDDSPRIGLSRCATSA